MAIPPKGPARHDPKLPNPHTPEPQSPGEPLRPLRPSVEASSSEPQGEGSHDGLGRPGGPGETARPDPIPNSAVKRLSAHGTVPQGPGESVAARPAKAIVARISGHPPAHESGHRPHSLDTTTKTAPHHRDAAQGDAGWSSPVARQAHNLKAAGSNPAPATTILRHDSHTAPRHMPRGQTAFERPRRRCTGEESVPAGREGTSRISAIKRLQPVSRRRSVLAPQRLLWRHHLIAIQLGQIRKQPRRGCFGHLARLPDLQRCQDRARAAALHRAHV